MNPLGSLLAAICLCCAAGAPSHAGATVNPPKPNILVIMTDEHNPGVMGCAGDALARTPNLDRLASRGIVFDAHYCASPICTPARQTFTTGKYVSQHNVWGNTVGVPETWPTIAKVVTAAGYDSYLVGKMHYRAGRSYGFTLLDREEAAAVGTKRAGTPKSEPRKRLPAGVFPDRGTEIGAEFSPLGESTDMETFVDVGRRDRAIRFLRERKAEDKPFFMVVGFIAPHYPLVAPPEYLARFKDKIPPPGIPAGYLDSLPLNYKHLRNDRKLERVPAETVKLARESYYARVEWTDHQIGQVLDALKGSELAHNTVVIYTSDHGESLGEHGLWWKNCMYDCSARVPLIVSWPARWPGGQRRTGACGAVDLVQTIARLGGGEPPPDWKGSSMLPWLDNPSVEWKNLAVCEYHAAYLASGITMIRQGDWKYVYHARADPLHGPERELYRMSDDPGELRNLAVKPEHQKRMTAMHAAMVREIGEDPEQTEARWRAGAIPEPPGGVQP